MASQSTDLQEPFVQSLIELYDSFFFKAKLVFVSIDGAATTHMLLLVNQFYA